METKFSAIILSSGLSERMGISKPLLKWDEETTFLQKIVEEYSKAGCSEIFCTVNKVNETFCKQMDFPCEVKFILNEYPEIGRFYSIRLASQFAKESEFCFIQNIDNPFVRFEIIKKLYENRNSQSWCSPVYQNNGGHPVLLSKTIFEKISEISENDFTLHDILSQFARKNVEINSDTILRNINTPEEYQEYFGSLF
jgi:CTP:molybdopterin cytidylyltransferase MocA